MSFHRLVGLRAIFRIGVFFDTHLVIFQTILPAGREFVFHYAMFPL